MKIYPNFLTKIVVFLVAISSPLLLLKISKSIAHQGTSICLAGDTRLGISKKPFQFVEKIFSTCNLKFLNLEEALTNYPHKTEAKSWESIKAKRNYIFKADPKLAFLLHEAHIDGVSLANNHSGDYQTQGMLDTMEALKKFHIGFAGMGKNLDEATSPLILNVNKNKIAFASFTKIVPIGFAATKTKPGMARLDPNLTQVKMALGKIPPDCALTIVSYHWGVEIADYPQSWQKDIAHKTIDMGADIIMGHHPHVLQGIEIYKDRPIFYSLGNFVFGSRSLAARTTMIAKVNLSESGKPTSIDIFPLLISNHRPIPAPDPASVIKRIIKASSPFGTKFIKNTNGTLTINL